MILIFQVKLAAADIVVLQMRIEDLVMLISQAKLLGADIVVLEMRIGNLVAHYQSKKVEFVNS